MARSTEQNRSRRDSSRALPKSSARRPLPESSARRPLPESSARRPLPESSVGLDFSRALPVLRKLYTQHPDADTELDYENPYQLLVATILSAQSTDAGVNRVTPVLFKRYPDAASLAKAKADELEPLIHATGFYRSKAKSLMGMARALVDGHGGNVPDTMEALVGLPGVGRKTANVVLGHALGVPGLPVDRHVLRVSNRIGIASSDDPEEVEQQLGGALPPAEWTKSSDTLILHGRRICKPKPLCDQCVVRDECDFYQQVAKRRGAQGPRKRSDRSGAGGPRD